jgi:hypothetical protein
VSTELPADLLEMDTLLRRAARDFEYPVTLPIAAGVSERLRPRAAPRFWSLPLARAAASVALALVAALGVSIAIPASRGALADFFNIGHVRVDKSPPAGSTPPALSPASFAEPSTLAQARAATDFPLRLPTRDGVALEPNAVYVQKADVSGVVYAVILSYDAYDLYETSAGLFGKGLPDPALLKEIEFDGRDAYWIEEGGHIAESYDAQGRLVVESRRTVDRATLLWEDGEVGYRLETSLSQDEALDVARSLR